MILSGPRGNTTVLRCILAVLLLLAVQATDALAAKRVALVIGNSAYLHTPRLENPRNDATDIAAALRKLRFEIIDGFDLGKVQFERKIRDFAAALRGAEAGVFFYAGHGLQVAGQNFLVPVDAELSTADALDFEMIRLEIVHRTMEREANTNIIFLDACRNNPLARNLARAMGTRSAEIGHGLAPVESGVGTLISFSTQPGNVALDGAGRNSPFAGALVKHMAAGSDDLSAILINVRNDVMKETQRKQVPWEHSALTGRFYFDPAGAKPGPSVDEVSWGLIKDSKDPGLLRRFIEQFPKSQWRAEAERKAASLAAVAPKEPAVEPKKAEPKPPPPPAPPASPATPPDEVAWSLIKDTKDPALLRRFAEQFPKSGKRAEAERRAAALAAAPPTPPPPAPSSQQRKSGTGNQKCFTFQGREFCP
jgi:hypothetical protein